MDALFVIAFKEVLREQFIDKNDVHIEGLGRFSVKHQKQYQKKFENGKVVLMPPKDVLEFKSNVRNLP